MMDTDHSEWAHALGQAVLQILGEHDRTQKWLACQVGVDPATISRIVKGQQSTTIDQVSRIARALGVTRRSVLARSGFLETGGESTLDLERLSPLARQIVLAAVDAALETEQ